MGEEVEITWRSSDGKTVGGVLVYPVGYEEGRRYPLIVAIHGGPASADLLRFNGGYNAQVYAGAGYAVLKPNYRGSRNYGNAHRTDIVGDYFTLGYEDIMTGVDHLIDEGIVDGDRMGALGWSAGGHWSNWILTHTDRFRAISSGAGTMNWISMYAQSDVQRNRRFYVGDGFLYDDFDTYFDQSPLRYIRNARTPTMIHVVKDDPRVPSPQSIELHMALKELGVPTELFVYPGADPRDPGSPQPAGQGRERDGLDGPLCPGHRREVRVEPGAGDAGEAGRAGGGVGAVATDAGPVSSGVCGGMQAGRSPGSGACSRHGYAVGRACVADAGPGGLPDGPVRRTERPLTAREPRVPAG